MIQWMVQLSLRPKTKQKKQQTHFCSRSSVPPATIATPPSSWGSPCITPLPSRDQSRDPVKMMRFSHRQHCGGQPCKQILWQLYDHPCTLFSHTMNHIELFRSLGWSPSSQEPQSSGEYELPAPPDLCDQKIRWCEQTWGVCAAAVEDESLSHHPLCDMVDGGSSSTSCEKEHIQEDCRESVCRSRQHWLWNGWSFAL